MCNVCMCLCVCDSKEHSFSLDFLCFFCHFSFAPFLLENIGWKIVETIMIEKHIQNYLMHVSATQRLQKAKTHTTNITKLHTHIGE